MAPGSAFARLLTLLSGQEFSIRHGALFVVAMGLMGFWLPTILLIHVEYLLGGVIAGVALGSAVEGFIGSAVGGALMALLWFVVLLAAGEAGLAVVTAMLIWGNATAGGLLGGWAGAKMG